jgi:toxin YoeB
MSYTVHLSPDAEDDLAKLKRNEPKAFDKARRLLYELNEHPRTGTGKPEPLTGDRSGQWSRRITQKHRMVYTIEDDIVKVYVLSSYGHYEDK